MKQISLQISDETANRIAALAEKWGLPKTRHNTPVIESAISLVYMLEIGCEKSDDELVKALDLMGYSKSEPAE